jgi:hypothetical protein
MKPAVLGTLVLLANPALADEPRGAQGNLFIGTPYSRANGYITQSSTTFRELETGASGTTGRLSHRQEMGSFDLMYSVNCTDFVFSAHADVNEGFSEQRAVSLKPFPEWLEVRFPEGTIASVGVDFAAPSAVEIASGRFREYLESGEPQAPSDVLIDGITNLVISRHSDRLRFIAEGMIAQTCLR